LPSQSSLFRRPNTIAVAVALIAALALGVALGPRLWWLFLGIFGTAGAMWAWRVSYWRTLRAQTVAVLILSILAVVFMTSVKPVVADGRGDDVRVMLGWPQEWLVQLQPNQVPGPEVVTLSNPRENPVVKVSPAALLVDLVTAGGLCIAVLLAMRQVHRTQLPRHRKGGSEEIATLRGG